MYTIRLSTRDAVDLDVACPPDMTVLEAAEGAGLYLPSMCRTGECGLCNAEIAAGAYALGDAAAPGAAPPPPATVPLCQCKPQGPLDIRLPYPDAEILRHSVPDRRARIVELRRLGTGAIALGQMLEPDEVNGQAAEFTPGQYMEVAIPETGIRRAYSMANLPNWDGRLDFIIRLAPQGAFSTWLAEQAEIGAPLTVRGPFGRFVLDEASPNDRVLVGGGCGLAPVLSMLRHMAEFGDSQPTQLIVGVNTVDELFAPEELASALETLPNVATIFTVWRPGPDWTGLRGTAAEAVDAHLAGLAAKPDVYVCGPPRLIETVRSAALTRGVPADRIFSEQVTAPAKPA